MIDVLRLPLIGRILKRRRGRLILQIPFLLIALLLIYDGFTGPPLAAQNLATIVPWVHFRGFAILALLLTGNLFCMGCPFALPRTLAKRFSLPGRRFPRVLRGKWLSIGALLLLFFLYEWLDLWASPALTAWVIIAYFAASFVLEALFSESAFCKYVCPLGAFNFVYATAAPTRIGVHDAAVCKTCVGKECLNGSYSPQPVILIDQIGTDGAPIRTHTHDKTGVPGCGTLLFAPQIQSNLDCTLCLDCARACPHDNVGLFIRALGAELTQPDAWHKRYDLALLVIGLAFMGLLNAFGMIPPVYALMSDLIDALGLRALGWSSSALEGVALLLIFAVGGVLLPALLTLAAAHAARLLTNTRRRDPLRTALTAFAPAFVPIGAGFWLAHYSFHLWIGFFTVVPALQAFLLDHRIAILGQPNWLLGGEPNLTLIGALQTLALLGGFIGSLAVASRTALRLYRRDAFLGLLPWALLLLALMLVGLWVFGQPMEMRGALFD